MLPALQELRIGHEFRIYELYTARRGDGLINTGADRDGDVACRLEACEFDRIGDEVDENLSNTQVALAYNLLKPHGLYAAHLQ